MEDTIRTMVDKKLEDVANRLQGDMRNQIYEEMWEHGNMVRDQMQQFMLMFSNQAHVRISPDFPPREHSDPILSSIGTSHKAVESSELGDDLVGMGEEAMEEARSYGEF